MTSPSGGPIDPRLWRSSAPTRRYLVTTSAYGVAIAALTIGSAVLLAHLVAAVVTDPTGTTLGSVGGMVALLAVLWVGRAALQWMQGRLSQRGATAVIADLNARLLVRVTALPPRESASQREDAAVLITRGLDDLRPYFTAYLPALFMAVILTPAALVTIWTVDTTSAIVVVVALPLIPVFMILIGLATRARADSALTSMANLQTQLLDLVAGIPTLRALGRALGPAPRITELNAAHRRSTMSTLRVAFLSALVLELLAMLGVALVAVGVGLRLVYGEMTLTAGLTALLLAPEVFWPLRRVGVEFHAAQAGKAAADRTFALFEAGTLVEPGTRCVAARGALISLRGVSVDGRDGSRPHGLSADVRPGYVTVLTGPNGCGKSTALQGILGLQPLTAGHVTVAGIDVRDLDPGPWWGQVAWLPQRPILLAGTVAENLELGGPIADLATVCATTGFDEVIAELPNGIHTVIGPEGVGLSLGQRQRLGLTRALGSSAPILLLDEPTAHLDDRSEARVLAAIGARAESGSTVIMVGHRDSVLAAADRIVAVGESANVGA